MSTAERGRGRGATSWLSPAILGSFLRVEGEKAISNWRKRKLLDIL